MKKLTYGALAVVAILVVMLWLFWGRHARLADSSLQKRLSAAEPTQPSSEVPGADITVEDLARIPGSESDSRKRERIVELREIMNEANQPVSFWGKIVDQDDAPVPGVKVKLNLRYVREFLPGATSDEFIYLDMDSDAQGNFSVTGRKGTLLGIKQMVKQGYEAGNFSARAYWYAPALATMLFTPDEKRPELFRMWKLAGAERLVRGGIGTGIPYDGQTVSFDLRNHKQVPSGGDIRVTLLRTPLQIERGQKKYDWTATIEAVEGGVIASSDEFMYRAPENGYVPKLTVTVTANDPDWSYTRSVAFFLKSRGTYARMRADFTTDSDRATTGFTVSGFINPSGSRNLEYDPMQDIADWAKPSAKSGSQKP